MKVGDRIEVGAFGWWEPATITRVSRLSGDSGVVVGFECDSGRGGAGIWGACWMRALEASREG